MMRFVTVCLAFVALATTGRAGTIHHVYSGESIQAAVDDAASGDEIIVHPGTYTERIDLSGKAITLRSSDGPEVTTIDGAGAGTVVTCSSGEGRDTVLEGFTITGGVADLGGGMHIDTASPTVRGCTFSHNHADQFGGGMWVGSGSPVVTGCRFLENTAGGSRASGGGGGICHMDASGHLTLINCTFIGNSATASASGLFVFVTAGGGAIYIADGTGSTLTNCVFSGNSVSATNQGGDPIWRACGGGIWNGSTDLTLTGCTFSANSITTSPPGSAWGGGLCSSPEGGSASVFNSIFYANTDDTSVPDVFGPAFVSFSRVQASHSGMSNIGDDPLFINADGPDDIFGTVDDDVHLAAGSPCIDAGLNDAVPADAQDLDGDDDTTEPLPFDLDGVPRIMDDPSTPDTPFGPPPIVDMGAHEFWPDCNENETPDAVDMADGTSTDCNETGVPDECEPGGDEDCNENGVSDLCDIFGRTSEDCNENGVLDECDIDDGTSADVDGDGVPDECEPVHNVTHNTRHRTIQVAVDLAVAGDEIEVGPGTYVERINLLGKAITLRSTDGPAATIIDGDAGGTVITCSTNEGPDTVIEGFTITNGFASFGGGMYNNRSSPTINHCAFSDNWADDGSGEGRGGGMYNYRSNPTVTNCTFSGNSADYGGGMANTHGSGTVINCTFNGNSARHGGGMTNNENSWAWTVINCTFSGNSADYGGGGMENFFSGPKVTNCTFSGNSATGSDPGGLGGGIYNRLGNPTLTNCTLWGNSARVGPGIHNGEGGSATATYSCIQGGWTGTGNIMTDPLFVDADGPDNVLGTADDDVRLQAGSPCIDAGDNTAVPSDTHDLDGDGIIAEPLSVDLFSARRFQDDPATADTGVGTPPIVDMGAYEYGSMPPANGDLDDDGGVDLYDYQYFSGCLDLSGPGVSPWFQECHDVFDFDEDADVDLVDSAAFHRLFTGPQ